MFQHERDKGVGHQIAREMRQRNSNQQKTAGALIGLQRRCVNFGCRAAVTATQSQLGTQPCATFTKRLSIRAMEAKMQDNFKGFLFLIGTTAPDLEIFIVTTC